MDWSNLPGLVHVVFCVRVSLLAWARALEPDVAWAKREIQAPRSRYPSRLAVLNAWCRCRDQ